MNNVQQSAVERQREQEEEEMRPRKQTARMHKLLATNRALTGREAKHSPTNASVPIPP